MNIWLINHYAVPPKYYPLARTTNFAKYLMRMGHTVTIFAASMVHNSSINLISDNTLYREDIVDGIHYVYVKTSFYSDNGKKRIFNMFQFAQRLPRVCKKFSQPDIIVASSATPMACMAGLKLAAKYRCKGIAEISDLWPESFIAYKMIDAQNPFLKLMYKYEKRIYEKADKIVFSMEGGRDYLIKKGWDIEHGGRINLKKVYHINNGIDSEQYAYNRDNYKLHDEDLDGQNFKVIYVGSIRRANHLKMLVDCAEQLKLLGNKDIKILIYGDGDERSELENLCVEKQLNNIFFKGKIDKTYVPYVLSKSDLNIVQVETTPVMRYGCSLNKLFDYFASEKPILSTLDVNYDLITRYHAGITLKGANPQRLAQEMIKFSLMGKDEYDTFCAGSKKAADDYDFRKLTSKLAELFQ